MTSDWNFLQLAQYLDQTEFKLKFFFVPGRDPDTDLQHRRGATVLRQAQCDLPQEGEEPERRVGVGRQH